ncbi:LamG-like jellyroll fold domain-containing protein [Flavobacterium silvaticum]|uniref:T9SS type A sorting domain-containing protein n=1 Tax=Flavobacterium silvaticum TaxID=1852020 RepID=A0A972FUM9_9FLAO|nr:LamG-like jellyroll fold domain-containing protein [Flavobacterium silvaticum]NMH28853.1 T9SS type A sorting domain-containing protein [Flavobacterium silvaticum]
MKHLYAILLLSLCCAPTLVAQEDLILHYTFDGNANDSSGNNNNGTVHNATLTEDRNGNPNGAYDFNGVDSYIDFPASASLDEIYTSEEVTIAAWINIRNWYQGWNVFPIIEQYNPLTDYGSLVLEANWASGGILFTSGYNYEIVGANYTWDFNAWHHVAVTYKKTESIVNFYVDGNLVGSSSYSQDFSPDSENLYAIGRSLSGPDEYTDGKIDEISVYKRAMTSEEIGDILAVSQNQIPTLKMYPNPATAVVNIENYASPDINIYSAEGRLVFSGSISNNKVNVDQLTPGFYFLNVDGKSLKFIKG